MRGHCPRKFWWIAEISDINKMILNLCAAKSNNYYDIIVCLMKIHLYNLECMDIRLQFSFFCEILNSLIAEIQNAPNCVRRRILTYLMSGYREYGQNTGI